METVVIIGGGASGMMAALSAAENKNNKVILLERQARVGKKLMATGNGRCNLTNTGASPRNYHGENSGFADTALGIFPPEKALEYFKSLGLVYTEEHGGRVYPLSDSAGSVLDVLRFAMESAGVEVRTGEQVRMANCSSGRFNVFSDAGAYQADRLIVACGGKAGGKIGGVSDGYDILRSFGHRCTKLYPALVPVKTDTDYPRSLKGVRADAALTLKLAGETLARSTGELQFTEKGVSGPAVFDISRQCSVYGGTISIDFLRNICHEEIKQKLISRRCMSPQLENANMFAGILHGRLGMAVVKYAGIKPSGLIRELGDREINSLAGAVKHFSLEVTGTDSFENAQVTAGGIDTSEFNSKTMESRLVPGLFACGEVLDVDADCGGYNLQWAWSSGFTAGRGGK